MKKTMFITSVIMVVVMAIALTTSSLAWFTASGAQNVVSSNVTLSASASASTGLLICNDAASWSADSVLPLTLSGTEVASATGMKPVNPVGTSVIEALAKNSFVGRTVDNSSGASLWSAEETYSDHYAGYVYVANAGDAAAINLKAEIQFANDVAGATLYVAVLASKTKNDNTAVTTTGTASDEWEVMIVSSNTNGTANNNLSNINIFTAATDYATGVGVNPGTSTSVGARTNNISSVSLNARPNDNVVNGDYQKFLILAWYSANLTNYNAGNSTLGSFNVKFTIGA